MATTEPDSTVIRIRDFQSRKLLHVLEGHTNPVSRFSFSPDGKHLASLSPDKTIRIWDLQTGQEVVTFRDEKEKPRTAVFSGDGKKILTAFGFRVQVQSLELLQEAIQRRPREMTTGERKRYLLPE